MDDRGRKRWSELTLSLLRIVSGALYSCHGAQKLLFWFTDPKTPPHPAFHFPELLWFAGIIELVGGGLFTLGIGTRPIAFVLSGEMAVAYFKAHFPNGWIPIMNHGELPVLYSFLFLYFFVQGGGPLSLERGWRRERRRG